MINPKAQTQPQRQPQIATSPIVSPAKIVMMPDTVPTRDRIRKRAYELYEARGREHGQDEEDWFRAEEGILNQKR